MYKIDVFQTHITINDYMMGDSISLERMLSYYDDITHQRVYVALKYIEEEKKLIIPRSISIPFLEMEFNHTANFNKYSNPYDKIFFMLKTQPRDDLQRETIAFLLGKDNYFYTKKFSQIGLNLKSTLGKTYCTIAALSELKMKTAIILHNSALLHQWAERIMEYTDMVEDEIYTISGADSIKKALNPKNQAKHKIYLMSHKTLTAMAKSNGLNSIGELFQLLRIGVKVFDEAHLEFYNILRIDFASNVYKTIYLSATTGRSDHKEDKIYHVTFRDVPFFGKEVNEEVDPHIYCTVIRYNSHPDYSEQSACKTKRGFSAMAYCHYCFTKGLTMFLDAFFMALDIAMKHDGKVAIIVPSNDRIRELEKHIVARYPDASVGIYTSIIEDKVKREKELECKIILSTTKSLSTGNDISDLTFLINTEAFSSPILAGQLPPRLRPIPGRKVMYFDIVDMGFIDCRRQLDSRMKVFRKDCKKVMMVDV